MAVKKIIDYYSQEDKITYLGEFKKDLANIESAAKACEVVNKILLIDFMDNMKLINVPAQYKDDVNVRAVEDKLKLLLSRKKSSLTDTRKNEEKLLGNCRDTSVLLCAIFRHNGISARVRSGFATFFSPKKKYDHWLCEYWDKEDSRWVKVDGWMYQIQSYEDILPPFFKAGLKKLSYNPLDVEDKHFIAGGQAWINCEEESDDANNYGTNEKHLRGMWFIRDNMLRDLLCLNKVELLPWDCRGLMSGERKEILKEDKEILSNVAHLLLDVENNFDEILEFYKQKKDLHY